MRRLFVDSARILFLYRGVIRKISTASLHEAAENLRNSSCFEGYSDRGRRRVLKRIAEMLHDEETAQKVFSQLPNLLTNIPSEGIALTELRKRTQWPDSDGSFRDMLCHFPVSVTSSDIVMLKAPKTFSSFGLAEKVRRKSWPSFVFLSRRIKRLLFNITGFSFFPAKGNRAQQVSAPIPVSKHKDPTVTCDVVHSASSSSEVVVAFSSLLKEHDVLFFPDVYNRIAQATESCGGLPFEDLVALFPERSAEWVRDHLASYGTIVRLGHQGDRVIVSAHPLALPPPYSSSLPKSKSPRACRLLQQKLSRYFQRCGHGKNRKLFKAAFVKGTEKDPLCRICHETIRAHGTISFDSIMLTSLFHLSPLPPQGHTSFFRRRVASYYDSNRCIFLQERFRYILRMSSTNDLGIMGSLTSWIAAHIYDRRMVFAANAFNIALDSERNGLPLHPIIENEFDQGNVAVVLVSVADDKATSKLRLMVWSGVRSRLLTKGYPLGILHGVEVVVPSPDPRCLLLKQQMAHALHPDEFPAPETQKFLSGIEGVEAIKMYIESMCVTTKDKTKLKPKERECSMDSDEIPGTLW